MKAKKILGWMIIIATILGLVLVQAVMLMSCWEKMSLLFALGLSIVIFLIEVAILVLIVLAVKWITD